MHTNRHRIFHHAASALVLATLLGQGACGGESAGATTSSEAAPGDTASATSGGYAGFHPVAAYRHCEGDDCTYVAPGGCTAPGKTYDASFCPDVRTMRPNPGIASQGSRQVKEDEARLSDPDLAWSAGEVQACACLCCHSAKLGGPGAFAWDIDFSPVWTDSATDRALAINAGIIDSSIFGDIDPKLNNGFIRTKMGLPTTDPDRMRAFLRRELERRGADITALEHEDPLGGNFIPPMSP